MKLLSGQFIFLNIQLAITSCLFFNCNHFHNDYLCLFVYLLIRFSRYRNIISLCHFIFDLQYVFIAHTQTLVMLFYAGAESPARCSPHPFWIIMTHILGHFFSALYKAIITSFFKLSKARHHL